MFSAVDQQPCSVDNSINRRKKKHGEGGDRKGGGWRMALLCFAGPTQTQTQEGRTGLDSQPRMNWRG
jgi:hypothetical protein